MTELLEAASEQLKCKSRRSPEVFLSMYICAEITIFCLGTCLDAADQDHWVSEWIAVLDGVSADTDTFCSNARRRQAVVWLQDHANDIEESVEGYWKDLMTIFTVMLPINPPPESFR
jgi:hypothetical protein